MEKLWIPKASESKEVEVENKSDAHCILRYLRHRSFQIPTPRPNSKPSIKRFFSVSKDQCVTRGGAFGKISCDAYHMWLAPHFHLLQCVPHVACN